MRQSHSKVVYKSITRYFLRGNYYTNVNFLVKYIAQFVMVLVLNFVLRSFTFYSSTK